MRHLLTLACLLFVTATVADEPEFDFSSVAAKKALRDYKKALVEDKKTIELKQKTLDEEAESLAKTTRDAFVENLKKALKKSMQAGALEEANKINAAINSLKKGTGLVTSSVADSKGKKNANSKARIPRNAVKWNGHHYLLSDRRVLHPDAKQRCELAGGHLIRIDDAREQAFAAKLASKGTQPGYWIDGSDEIREGKWLFSNGDPIQTFFWSDGEPNNMNGSDHHIEMRQDRGWKWNDHKSLGVANGFICEWDE